jgi:dolichol-phosphate mannosyltransferase
LTEIRTPPPEGDRPIVSIVLATLNEAENLPRLVEAIEREPLPPFEMIFVDDGSTDGTREFLNGLAAHDPRVRLIFHDGKQTTVKAQGQGVLAARGGFVVIMDSDFQHPTSALPLLVAALERGATLAVATRYREGGSTSQRSVIRAAISRGAGRIAKLFLPDARRTSDPISGYFAFRRDGYEPLDPELRGYKLLLFLLVMARGRPIAEVGYRFEPRAAGASKLTQGPAFLKVFVSEVMVARRFARDRWGRRAPAASLPEPTRL